MTSADFERKIKQSLHIIGVIGHRNLLDHDCHYSENGELIEGELVPIIREKLKDIVNSAYPEGKKTTQKIILLTSMAKGADQLVAKVATEYDLIEVICILPCSVSNYKDQMKDSEDNGEMPILFLNNFLNNIPNCIGSFNLHESVSSIDDTIAYENVGKFIISNCDSMLFLWDGVFTGSRGGTSVSYHQALDGFNLDKNFNSDFIIRKSKERIVYHLSTPRKTNPFPVGKRYISDNRKFNIADYSKVYPYQWHITPIDSPIGTYKKRRKKAEISQSIFRNKFFWAYIIPFIIGSGMVFAWAANYFSYVKTGFWNKTQEFLKLLKMTGGNIDSGFLSKPNLEKIAISLGIMVFLYVLAITLIYALANDRRIAATRIEGYINKRFNLILGLGWKGMELAQNLNGNGTKKGNKKVVAIEKNEANTNIKGALKNGIRVVNGNFCNTDILDKIGWHKAQDIYILGNDDETNIRALQLLDSQMNYCKDVSLNKEIGVYVHLDDFRNKFFVNKALQNNKHLKLNCFSIYENAIRRILLKHPVDRFYYNDIRSKLNCIQADTVKIIILGFNPAAQALFRYCFTHCIYEAGIKVEIQVYLDHKEAGIKQIKKDIPYVFQEVKLNTNNAKELNIYKINPDSEVGKYVYEYFTVKIFELPDSEYGILEDADYLNNMQQSETTSIFACINDGLLSSAYLSAILPALEVKKQQFTLDLQVYCYFNFPEENENTFIEESINKIAKTVPVFFFGNFSEEFTEEAIKNQEQDNLAKMTNEFYWVSKQKDKVRSLREDLIIDGGLEKLLDLVDIETNNTDKGYPKKWNFKNWGKLDEYKRESSRLAADHLFIKLRFLHVYLKHNNNSEFVYENYFWKTIKNQIPKNEKEKLTGKLYEITEMEHRRWCAERLFYGWKYFESQTPTIEEWNDIRKIKYEPQKIHIDLQEFDSIDDSEKVKDLIITENIDLIMWLLDRIKLFAKDTDNQL